MLRQVSRVRYNSQGVHLSDEPGVALIFRPLFTSTSLRGCHEIGILRGSRPAGGSSRLTKGGDQVALRIRKEEEREETAR